MLHLIKMLNRLSSLMGFKDCCSNLQLLRQGGGMKSLLRAAALPLHPFHTGFARGSVRAASGEGGFCCRITECLGEDQSCYPDVCGSVPLLVRTAACCEL